MIIIIEIGTLINGKDVKVRTRLVYGRWSTVSSLILETLVSFESFVPNGTTSKRQDVARRHVGMMPKVGYFTTLQYNKPQGPLGTSPSNGTICPFKQIATFGKDE
jgi:hypothetical protein